MDDKPRNCTTCKYGLGNDVCASSLEKECADGGFEAWIGEDNQSQTPFNIRDFVVNRLDKIQPSHSDTIIWNMDNVAFRASLEAFRDRE